MTLQCFRSFQLWSSVFTPNLKAITSDSNSVWACTQESQEHGQTPMNFKAVQLQEAFVQSFAGLAGKCRKKRSHQVQGSAVADLIRLWVKEHAHRLSENSVLGIISLR